MELKNDSELANTRTQLADLEARCEELRHDTTENAHVREVTIRSLTRYINQLKEEIARYECRGAGQHDTEERASGSGDIQSDAQLNNTREKLSRLEQRLVSNRSGDGDKELRRAERISLKRLINQFKEEIARYEAHQPAQ
jgi:hypothetical protein